MQQFLQYKYFNNTVSDYLLFLISLAVSCIVIKIIRHFLFKHLDKLAEKTKTSVDGPLAIGIKKYLMPTLYFAAFYLNTTILYLNPTLTKIMHTLILAFIMVIGAMFITSLVVFLLSKYLENKINDANNNLAIKWVSGITKTVIWGLVLILFLDNVGFKINSLIAGLGIGGIAIVFAAQSILTDIFCFITILFDRPFEIGDFIITGDQMGTVEHIGVKTTRLRSLNGEQLIFSNADLTGSRISNYKTMEQRRVLFTLGVPYDTSVDKLKEIPGLIKSIVDDVPETTFGRTHFFSYSTYSLNFEIAYYVLSNDYDKYMNINQEINLRIKEEFDKQGIEFALPAQTLQMHGPSVIAAEKSESI